MVRLLCVLWDGPGQQNAQGPAAAAQWRQGLWQDTGVEGVQQGLMRCQVQRRDLRFMEWLFVLLQNLRPRPENAHTYEQEHTVDLLHPKKADRDAGVSDQRMLQGLQSSKLVTILEVHLAHQECALQQDADAKDHQGGQLVRKDMRCLGGEQRLRTEGMPAR